MAFAKLTKNKAMLSVLLALIAFAGSASAYTPTYTTDDLGLSIVDLIVTFIVAFTAKSPTLAGLFVVLATMAIIGSIVGTIVGVAWLVMNFGKRRPARG